MSSDLARRTTADPEWERHKETIHSLYVDRKFKLEGLVETMAESPYGFQRSKAQFEYQLRKWGFKKYLKKEDWEHISQEIARRKAAGKGSEVLFNNKLIQGANVHRQIVRKGFANTINHRIQEPIPRASPNIRIRTPIEEDLALVPQLQSGTPFSPSRRVELPLFQMEDRMSSPPVDADNIEYEFSQVANRPFQDGTDVSFYPQFEDASLGLHYWTADLPILQLSASLSEHASYLSNLIVTRPFHMDSPQNLLSPVGSHSPTLACSRQVDAPRMLENRHQIMDHLGDRNDQSRMEMFKALLPKIALMRQLEGHVIFPQDDFMKSIISSLLIYSVSNNFAGLGRLPRAMVLEYFKDQKDHRFLQYIQHAEGPAVEAFVEKLFPIAIESRETFIVDLLLKKGLNPNKIFLDSGGSWRTPIGLSSRMHSIEITRLLLRAGAAVNGTDGKSTVLENALKGDNGQSIPPRELLRMIIDAGSKITDTVIDIAFENRYRYNLVVFLASFGSKTNLVHWIKEGILERIAKCFDDETATEMVESILPSCGNAADGSSSQVHKILQDAQEAAAAKGNLRLMKLLLPHTELTQLSLALAIKSTNKDLIWFLLDTGTDVDILVKRRLLERRADVDVLVQRRVLERRADVDVLVPRHFTMHGRGLTTPLAEAIRLGNEEVMSFIETKGGWSLVQEIRRFQAALVAASEVGNYSLVQRLLTDREDLPAAAFVEALLEALANNHEVSALVLLDALVSVGVQDLWQGGRMRAILKIASGKGQVAVVQRLLGATQIIDPLDLHGALLEAIKEDREKIALILFKACADTEGVGEYKGEESALGVAVRKRNAKFVRLILDADVNIHIHINSPRPYVGKWQPVLIEACEWGNHSVVQMLIASGADVDDVGHGGFTPLTSAVKRKDYVLMKLLLDAGAAINHPFSILQAEDPSYIVQWPDDRLWIWKLKTPLTVAATNGDLEMIEYVLRIGGNANDSQALLESLRWLPQAVTITEKLLTAFSDRYPHGRKHYGCKVLLKAVRERRLWLVDVLLQAGVDALGFLKSDRTALLAAIELENDEDLSILRRCMETVRNPNSIVQQPDYVDVGGIGFGLWAGRRTALLAAIRTRNIQKVQLLIDAGAEVNWPATRGVQRTPLQEAAEMGNLQVIQFLLREGALVNAQPAARAGATALQFAAIRGYIGIAELLLENDADVNAPAAIRYGRTALEGAAEYGRIDMVKLLFNVGVKIRGLGQQQFERALHLAQINGHLACRRYLETLSKLGAQECYQASERGRESLSKSEPH